MQVTVEFFGVLRALAGTDRARIELPARARVSHAYRELAARYPDLADRLHSTACAIGDTLVARDAPLADDARLALIPPVSGG